MIVNQTLRVGKKIKKSNFNFDGIISLYTGSYKNKTLSGTGFVEEADYEEGFSEHYEKYLRPNVEKFEKSRMEALKTASNRAKIITPILLVGTIVSLFFFATAESVSNAGIKFGLGAIIVVYIFCFAQICSSMTKYNNSIKSDIFPKIMSFLGDYKYSPKCDDMAHHYLDSKIIPKYDREQSEDYISGLYNGVGLKLFESDLQTKHRDSKGNISYKTAFKGVIISLTMHKNFHGQTIVIKDSGKWFKKNFSQLENVKLEDPRFEKIFEVYSDDQIEARYLLTTSFMDRLLMLVESFGGSKIECSFYNNHLLMTIPVQGDIFEPGSIFEPEDFVDDAKKLLKEMNLLFGIIDILKLDQNIGM